MRRFVGAMGFIVGALCLGGNASSAGIDTEKGTCTDLTGSWQGSCKVTDGAKSWQSPLSLSITQKGCEEITTQQFLKFSIGGTQTITDASPKGASSLLIRTNWSEDRTVLVQDISSSFRFFEEGQVEVTGKSRVTYLLRNGALLTESSSDFGVQQVTSRCTLARVD